MVKETVRILASAFVLLWPAVSVGATYCVDQKHASADDSNPGTISKPWKTIQHASENATAGDSIFIRSGVYREQVWTCTSGGGSKARIVFSAFPGERPVLDGSGMAEASNGFTVGHSWIALNGLEIRNWDTGIWMEGAGNVEISDCEVHHCFYGIAAVQGVHDFALNRVDIHHFNLFGFDASPGGGADCSNGVFNDCTVHTANDPGQNVDGFALGHGTQHGFTFNRCTAFDVYDGFDISARNSILNRCLAFDCWNGGYKLWQDRILLVNCIGYGCQGANVELDWDGTPGRSSLVNCTFFDVHTYTVWVENSRDTLWMHNCILAGGRNIGLAFEQSGVRNYRGDYNLFHNDNPDRAIAVAYTDEFTLDQVESGAWRTYSGQDAHSLVSRSKTDVFIDPAKPDLRLKQASPAVDRGTAEGAPTVDFNGNPRPAGNGIDIGAYEYSRASSLPDGPQSMTIPRTFSVQQNYPNPFNSETRFRFFVKEPCRVLLKVTDLTGREVKTVVDSRYAAGEYFVRFNASGLSSGIYSYRIRMGDFQAVGKMVVMK